MSGNKEGAAKRINSLRERGYDFSKSASIAGKHSSGGFSTQTIGKDGLTGPERAKKAAKKSMETNPNSLKNNPERAREISKEYWRKKHEDSNISY